MKNKVPDFTHYRKLVSRLFWAFFSTILLLSLVFALIIFLLSKFGIDLHSKIFNASWRSLGLCIICFVLSASLSYVAVWYYFHPLQELSRASKKIAAGDYSIRLNYNGKIRELAEAFENFNHMAEELDSVEMIRSDFITNVSHEFKTPLTSLNGCLTLLQDSSLSEEERSTYISKAMFSVSKLNDMTDNILRLSRLENQQKLDEPTTYRLDEQLREAIVLLEPKWSKKSITLDLDLPEKEYTGQRSLMLQVWTNIIGNAVKFSHEGGCIGVKLEESEHHFKVYISDEGIGMSEETQQHIFDKFYQADTSRQSQGNGLGLALCKEILSRCNGKIYVTSTPGKGSVFLVSLKKV